MTSTTGVVSQKEEEYDDAPQESYTPIEVLQSFPELLMLYKWRDWFLGRTDKMLSQNWRISVIWKESNGWGARYSLLLEDFSYWRRRMNHSAHNRLEELQSNEKALCQKSYDIVTVQEKFERPKQKEVLVAEFDELVTSVRRQKEKRGTNSNGESYFERRKAQRALWKGCWQCTTFFWIQPEPLVSVHDRETLQKMILVELFFFWKRMKTLIVMVPPKERKWHRRCAWKNAWTNEHILLIFFEGKEKQILLHISIMEMALLLLIPWNSYDRYKMVSKEILFSLRICGRNMGKQLKTPWKRSECSFFRKQFWDDSKNKLKKKIFWRDFESFPVEHTNIFTETGTCYPFNLFSFIHVSERRNHIGGEKRT